MGVSVFEDDIEDAGAETRALQELTKIIRLKEQLADNLRDEIIMLNSEITERAKQRKAALAERDALQDIKDRLTKGLL